MTNHLLDEPLNIILSQPLCTTRESQEKATINALSITADDFSTLPSSATKLYTAIKTRLLQTSTPGHLIPLVYVIDSLLKNVGGTYIPIILNDAQSWMGSVHDTLSKSGDVSGVARLKKVWNTWREQGVVKDESMWKKIGECFEEKEVIDVDAVEGGFAKNPDGTLKLPNSLRRQMQILLDEVQNTSEVDELDKVSLERLAEINPDLLRQIQTEAEMVLLDKQQTVIGSVTTSNAAATQESEWSKLKLNHLDKSNTIISNLQRHVRLASTTTTVPKSECDSTIHLYAAVSASAQLLTDMLQEFNLQKDGAQSPLVKRKRRYSLVKPSKFTTDGIKERNDAVIARLYEVGLPFVCSADGRRFGTQLELSKHLDALFRKRYVNNIYEHCAVNCFLFKYMKFLNNFFHALATCSQLEKSMEKTEERGWYTNETTWIGANNTISSQEETKSEDKETLDDTSINNNEAATVLADENRSKCILCGISFAMHFDQDDGEWKYKNCIEKDVLKEDDGPTLDEEEFEAVLVHRTCWEGLGRPEFLTPDQVLHAM